MALKGIDVNISLTIIICRADRVDPWRPGLLLAH